MIEALGQSATQRAQPGTDDVFIVLCASGFERVRSALMFATLAASANYRTVLYESMPECPVALARG